MSPSRTLVLLEDDDLDAELIEEQLRAERVELEVRRAADEASYCGLLEATDVALVLSDFSLPGYDGVAALEAARRLAPRAPFIFVSGAIGEELAIDTMRRGATDYVLKHRLERLGPAVRRALAEADSRLQRERAEAERDTLLASERRARESAEDANRLKDEFLAVVSHELRTPLNAILGWASLLVSDRADDATRRRGLETIVRNARVQGRLIEDILDISRIISGKLHLHVTQVGVETFVKASLEAVRPAAAAKNIRIRAAIDPDAGDIVADGERLQQVVWNLVSNAVKFTPAGGSVDVEARRRASSLVLSVTDTGAGMEPELLPFVFDRFRQGDSSKTRAHGGLGLGLSIVRHVTEMHGGTVRASSPGPGCGSTFTIELPLGAPAAAVVPTPAPPSPDPVHDGALASSAPPVRYLGGVRVLVVDDEHDARELVREVLLGTGADVATAASVGEAFRLLETFHPHVLVSDVGMPGTDGYAFIRQLRARSAADGGRVPAIALTAYARELDRREAERAGFQRHLAKPIAPNVLVETVHQLAAPGDGSGDGPS